jgi:hypothetical protein
MHGSTQIISLLAWSSLSGSERFQRLLSIGTAVVPVLLPLYLPLPYLRWRSEVFLVYRLIFFAYPLLRKPAGARLPNCSRVQACALLAATGRALLPPAAPPARGSLSPTGIQRVLDAPPQPGLRGLLKDLWKVIWGKAAGARPEPPAPHGPRVAPRAAWQPSRPGIFGDPRTSSDALGSRA